MTYAKTTRRRGQPAPAGTAVSLYVDLVERVSTGDVIQTQAGRRYLVASVRVQAKGKHAGRQHLRAVVLEKDVCDAELSRIVGESPRVHVIRWYKRKARKHARST